MSHTWFLERGRPTAHNKDLSKVSLQYRRWTSIQLSATLQALGTTTALSLSSGQVYQHGFKLQHRPWMPEWPLVVTQTTYIKIKP